jgi:uncharacterized OB-fold protein
MAAERIAIKEGLFAGPLEHLEEVHLAGSRCASCGETSLGATSTCSNCGDENLAPVVLGDTGTLYTYTIVRHRPPGNYQGPADFKPFGLGLVEVDGAIRVMAPLSTDPEDLRIGMPLKFHPYVLRTTEAGEEVVAFTYDAAGE